MDEDVKEGWPCRTDWQARVPRRGLCKLLPFIGFSKAGLQLLNLWSVDTEAFQKYCPENIGEKTVLSGSKHFKIQFKLFLRCVLDR